MNQNIKETTALLATILAINNASPAFANNVDKAPVLDKTSHQEFVTTARENLFNLEHQAEITFDFDNPDLEIAKKELDRWGWFINQNDTNYFALGEGTKFDKTELKKGDILVSNCFSTNLSEQKGKNVLFYQADCDNPRISFTATDGQWFIMRHNKNISLETCKKAMEKTILWYHDTDPNNPEYTALKTKFTEIKPQK
jgi:hypothetical protein